MNRGVTSFMKGMGTGIAAATIIGVTGKMYMSSHKNIKKKVNKAAKTIGDIVDNVQYFMK